MPITKVKDVKFAEVTLIIGDPASGKTTLALSKVTGSTLFISIGTLGQLPDEGEVLVPDFRKDSSNPLIEFFEVGKYDTIVLDGLDLIISTTFETMQKGGNNQALWGDVGRRILAMLTHLRLQCKQLLLVVGTKEIITENTGNTPKMGRDLSLNRDAENRILPICSEIMYCYAFVNTKTQEVVYTVQQNKVLALRLIPQPMERPTQ
jgi:hypothetical protein